MRKIERSAIVSFSAQKMYALVSDIEAYPDFIEGCTGARILTRNTDWLEAKLDLTKGGVTQSLTTRNHWEEGKSIGMRLVEGPFRQFSADWRFTALETNSSKIEFALQYEFKNRILSVLANKLIDSVANEQVKCMCERAKALYS